MIWNVSTEFYLKWILGDCKPASPKYYKGMNETEWIYWNLPGSSAARLMQLDFLPNVWENSIHTNPSMPLLQIQKTLPNEQRVCKMSKMPDWLRSILKDAVWHDQNQLHKMVGPNQIVWSWNQRKKGCKRIGSQLSDHPKGIWYHQVFNFVPACKIRQHYREKLRLMRRILEAKEREIVGVVPKTRQSCLAY